MPLTLYSVPLPKFMVTFFSAVTACLGEALTALRAPAAVQVFLFGFFEITAGVSAALTLPVLKSLGITVVGRFSGEICRDAGQSAVASALETCSAAAALYAALPLVKLVVSLLGAGA